MHLLLYLSFILLRLFSSALTADVPLDCQQGWTLRGFQCYRLFQTVLPWSSARRVCQSHGSRLFKVKDYYENEDVGKFVQSHGISEYWIGISRLEVSEFDGRALQWSDGEATTVAVGYWQNAQPDTDSGKCVMARLDNGRTLWSLAPCERKTPYVCQRPAAPQGSFHCHNGRFVRQGLTCDGEDDCGDGSDELSCNSRCSYHMKNQQTGSITFSSDQDTSPARRTCTWLIELQLGYNVKVTFSQLNVSRDGEVLVLAGGMTVSTSRLVARLSGDQSASLQQPFFISINNLMMITFSAGDSVATDWGFAATFAPVTDEVFPTRKTLVATDTSQEITSPLYPIRYLGSQDYTWVITAQEKVKIVTLEIVEVDLRGDDRILIRDGDMVYDDLLAELTSTSPIPPYVLSTGRNLYVTMQTRGQETGKGFKFNYWQGCSVTLNSISGEIHSPGYRSLGGQYERYQNCTYDVNVPGGAPVTVRFNSLMLHESDRVLVYADSRLVHNVTGSVAPPPFPITTGSFRVIFNSDAILTDQGFSITYSVGCSRPDFSNETLVSPSTTEFNFGFKLDVSCRTGYAFAAQEFQDNVVEDRFQAVQEVNMECLEGGVWDVRTLPLCKPRYCGQAPAVANAYVMASSGVTYMSKVQYQCYRGFAMQEDATVTCSEVGEWSHTPACRTSACNKAPTRIANGIVTIRAGDGRSFGSIVEFKCNENYQIVGDPILFCMSSGQWSALEPKCEVLRCFVPSIPNGFLTTTSGGFVDVGETVTASCNGGYSNVAGDVTLNVTCMGDRSLSGLDGFTCTYQDKCAADTDYCDHMCHDSEFGERTCSCYKGYALEADGKTCRDIAECNDNRGGCDHMCDDIPGSYQCSCHAGYVLFSADGILGYFLAPNEDGMRPGDGRRINHTCLRVPCPSPPVVNNGDLMVNLNRYHYGDVVEYTCRMGFEFSGSSYLTCDKDGQWAGTTPMCIPARCLPDTVPTEPPRNLATVTPTGYVGLRETVTLTCDVPGRDIYNKTRRCVFYQGRYQLVGADYECELINCGQPILPTTSAAPVVLNNTTYGAYFRFTCQDMYAVKGRSEAGDEIVRCTKHMVWDFGSLRCEGLTCEDPGTPPDGRQVNSTSYDRDDLVYYKCNKDGFTLDNPYPLLCRLNATGNGLEWNSSVPNCIDTQKPQLIGCPTEPIRVARYTKASEAFKLPNVTDNVNISKYRVTNNMGGSPIWPSDDYVIDAVTTFYVTARDFAGNDVDCNIVIFVNDDISPNITCPDTVIREFVTENQVISVRFDDLVSASDDSLENVTIDIEPPDITFTAIPAQLISSFPRFRSYDVSATARDSSGNTATCDFQVVFKPESCSPYTLRTPLNGDKTCETLPGDRIQCVLTCDDGFIFYDAPSNSSFNVSCGKGEDWGLTARPLCVRANDQNARFRQTYRFTYEKTEKGQCHDDVYKDALETSGVLDQTEALLPAVCLIEPAENRIQGKLTIVDVDEPNDNKVHIDITLTYDPRDDEVYRECGALIKTQFEGDSYKVTSWLRNTTFTPVGCPQITTSKGAKMLSSEYFCVAGKKIQYQPNENSTAVEVCVSCPEGTRTVGNACELCPEGTFSSQPGSASCEDCPPNTSTFSKGAVSNGECTALCAAGRYSSTGLPPCMMCPKNTYSSNNSTYCTPCPEGHVTRGTGSTQSTECLPPCPEGTYNFIDGHGVGDQCQPCPLNTYSDTPASKYCKECDNAAVTERQGSASANDCVAHADCTCERGDCGFFNHAVFCSCPDGYNGQYCEEWVDPCSSDPCYRDGQCSSSGSSFTCSCPAGTRGPRCEVLDPSCTSVSCLNSGACRNDLQGATCLCQPGFSGDRCQSNSSICETNNCLNDGRCVSLDNVRYRCECATGYAGNTCQNNIDDCASKPCLHGGTCEDLVNDFRCSCPDDYSGPLCETRRPQCDDVSCNAGVCVDDYQAGTYRCVCPEGNYYGRVCQYRLNIMRDSDGTPTWLSYNTSTVTLQECMDRCEADDCRDFLYDSSSSTCRVADPRHSLSVQNGALSHYQRLCARVEETYWTPWQDSSFPNSIFSGSEDEQLTTLNYKFGLNICEGTDALEAECRVVGTHKKPPESSVQCSPIRGLYCLNSQQPNHRCENYEIRFKCLSSRVLSKSPCQDIDYCGDGDVCQNGGTCSETPTGPSCSCVNGYTGSRCQHNQDDCVGDPCQNNGTCVDMLNDYRCDCLPGYGGRQCTVDINECSSNPCSPTGTRKCEDLLNNYSCMCKDGFTGRHCEIDIDECASQPCLHQGRCVDQRNNFTCECTPGWMGRLCTSQVEKCTSTTCGNGAPCYNIFNDFYCSCNPNTHGKTCDNASSICATEENPCLNSGACTMYHGAPQCSCPPEYSGQGCEIRRDVCSARNLVCKNGAKCTSSMEEFTCQCAPGYTGRYCDQNINDCQPNTCPDSSTCIDMVNKHFCRCPVGKAGDNCEKDVNREFDMLFNDPDKNNMAALGYPLRLAGGGFSITMWIQFKHKGAVGTFFTMYQVRDPNSLSEKREMIRLDHTGLTWSLFPGQPAQTRNTTVDYHKDGKWHYIALSYNSATRLFSFFVDTIRTPMYVEDSTVRQLDLNVWMVLGCRYDNRNDRCHRNLGFNGYISQVSLYNRELLFEEELTVVGNRQPFHVFSGVIMTWGEFQLYPGVTRVYPSKADRSCPVGFSDWPDCVTPTTGKTEVRVDRSSCPRDIMKYSSDRVTQVTVPDVNFPGSTNQIQVKSSRASVIRELWGKYPVVMEATNQDGNKALCTFDIYIQNDNCATPRTTSDVGDIVFCVDGDYRQCSMNCQRGRRVVVHSPEIHTCGPVGSWDPPNRYLPYVLPPCGATSAPKRRLIVLIAYHVPSLECGVLEEEIDEQVARRLQNQNTLYSGLCKKSDCSDIQRIITCKQQQAGRRAARAVPVTDIMVKIIADNVPTTLTSASDPTVTRSPENLFRQLVLDDTVFDLSELIAQAAPDPNGLDVKIELTCQPPTALIEDQCVRCAAGTYYDVNTTACIRCAIGSYQTQDGQMGCTACNPGTTTETEGSVNSNQCKSVCNKGHYYDMDEGRCSPCPQGFYQNVSGLFYCLPCPADTTTRQPGQTSEAFCFNDCPPGEELALNGTCTPCAIGFYKPANQTLCDQCPWGVVTSRPGSDSINDCNVASCSAGYKVKDNECEPCPQGTYQEQPYQGYCDPCPSGQSTRQTASTLATDCETYCEPGQEKKDGVCEFCPQGYYKNNLDDFFMNCTMCHPDYVTPANGSYYSSQCTLRNCTAGEYDSGSGSTNCTLCDVGYYQPKRWQESCLKCATDKTTQGRGAVSETECILSCPPGKEELPGANVCTECRQGYYKDEEVAALCYPCPSGYVTRFNGSTTDSDCSLRACEAGYFSEDTDCSPCPFGQYQPDKWQEQCIACPTGQTTYQEGATNRDSCFIDCSPGYQPKEDGTDCELCPRGYYNDDLNRTRYTCTMCPEDFITENTGATSHSACNVRNCTVLGQFLEEGDNSCRDCPLGQWQDRKWQTSCNECNTGLTTKTTGSWRQSDCLLDCPSGQQLDQSGSCSACPKGSYRNKVDNWECKPCATGLTTQSSGAASSTECSISTCAEGFFYDSNNAGGCKECPLNSYQDRAGQFTCKPCPRQTETRQTGSTSASQCLDGCLTSLITCDDNAQCAGSSGGVFECVCNDGYMGNGTSCTHMCDMVNYCRNGASCDRQQRKCQCTANYEGATCESRLESRPVGLTEKDTIIVAVVCTFIFILIVVLLVVYCCRRARQQLQSSSPDLSDRASIATRMSSRGLHGNMYNVQHQAFSPEKKMLPLQSHYIYNPAYDDVAVYQP